MSLHFPHVDLDERVRDDNVTFLELLGYFSAITGYSFTKETLQVMASWLEKHYVPGKSKTGFSKFYFARKLFLIFTTRKYQTNHKELPGKEDFDVTFTNENPEKRRIEEEFSALGSDEQFQI